MPCLARICRHSRLHPPSLFQAHNSIRERRTPLVTPRISEWFAQVWHSAACCRVRCGARVFHAGSQPLRIHPRSDLDRLMHSLHRTGDFCTATDFEKSSRAIGRRSSNHKLQAHGMDKASGMILIIYSHTRVGRIQKKVNREHCASHLLSQGLINQRIVRPARMLRTGDRHRRTRAPLYRARQSLGQRPSGRRVATSARAQS